MGFQSTLPRRERQKAIDTNKIVVIFQSTLPRRERHQCKRKRRNINRFQSTLPRRERLCSYLWVPCFGADFNPHSHEGSDDILEDTDKGDEYFNPHSHEGSDLNSGTAETVTVDFNPHSHEGSDYYPCMCHPTRW